MFFALAFTVAQIADKDMLKEFHQAMQQAIENGTPFHDFQKRLKPYLMAKGWLAPTGEPTDELLKAHQKHLGQRLRVIYHTNKQTAYAAGQWERIQQTKEFLPYLQYMPSLSENKRDSHQRYYGLVRPVDDPIWASLMPPNGFGCKCWVKQITKSEAKRQGISEPIELETETIKNPATGEMVETPKGVHFSFNHNHDRLTAMLKLAEDKHGTVFGEKLRAHLDEIMLGLTKDKGVAVANFAGITVAQSEVERLLIDKLDNKPKLHEAQAGAEYQAHYGVRLERPEPVFDNGNPQAGFDYWVADDGKKLDFMYTMHGYNEFKVGKFNEFFAKTHEHWQKQIDDILNHLQKADIVPLDLRYLSTENRTKLIAFVLSLSEKQKKQIVLIEGKL
ncbi:MAG: phage minor head protein [Moraxella sp.]|nr:phage minor head protein [Moraxella sp.]